MESNFLEVGICQLSVSELVYTCAGSVNATTSSVFRSTCTSYAFTWLFILSFVSMFSSNLVCLLLLISLLLLLLCTCLFVKERKNGKVQIRASGKWGASGRSWRRGKHNQNLLYEKIYISHKKILFLICD